MSRLAPDQNPHKYPKFLEGYIPAEIQLRGELSRGIKYSEDSDKCACLRIPLDTVKPVTRESFDFMLKPLAENWRINIDLVNEKSIDRPFLAISVNWPQGVLPDAGKILEATGRFIAVINDIYDVIRK